MLKKYLGKIAATARQGDAREESYYSTLASFLTGFANSKGRRNIHVTSQPKKTDAGNPDFRIWDGKQRIVGYVEAKTPDKNLDDVEKTEQVERYKTTFPNFMLTNFLEFRLFRNELMVAKVRIADPVSIYSLKGTPFTKNEAQFEDLLEKFFAFSLPSITSAHQLAVELAKRTRFLRDEVVAEELREEEKNGLGKIIGFFEAFRTYLIRGLTREQFADLYSQTITYGLFASRMRCEGDFNRRLAVYDIPRSIGILREMFEFISLGDLPSQLEWIVDDISNVLANVDVKKIFSEYYRTKKGEDPVFHFYETFLAKYDPEERERRGVYYTPKPVVSYIVHSLDAILKEKFGLEDGLANENVTILDPAAGTLTFIADAIKKAIETFTSKYGEGAKEGLIKEHIIKNFYAFELMIAPYAIGHVKISFLLEELGYKLLDEDLKFHLTNTLELEDIEQTSLPGMASLAEESRKAGEVKKRIPIWVILGNPPYSGISANMGEWITGLIGDYRYVDGKPLGEKNPKWLQDDYVKFIRFAEWKINQVANGAIGYITNHSYLDNPTFRGMRQHLTNSFNEIYVLDLHGSALKREICPDGSKDENVFDIRQGVAISFFVRNKGTSSNNDCRIFHGQIWGLRDRKYEWLNSHDLRRTEWKEIHPHSPFYLFVPIEEKYAKLYNGFWKVTDIFPINCVGVVTSRDKFVVDFDEKVLKRRIETFRNTSISDEFLKNNFKLRDKSDWKLSNVRNKVIGDNEWDKYFTKIAYRPFDVRTVYYNPQLIERTRYNVMRHMLQKNIGLLWTRPMSPRYKFSVFISDKIIDQCVVGNKTAGAGISYIAPLILHNRTKNTNLDARLIRLLKRFYEIEIEQEPERILYYIYAIFYSNEFCEKYKEFLKIDFPRVPFTNDYVLFKKMAEFGKRLIDLHLVKSKELSSPTTKFQGEGDNVVLKPTYENERVYINKTQFFEGIDNDVWEYQIGGYQVLLKWLKDRKGQNLSLNDIKHYCKVATALERTIEIQGDIDRLYPSVEKNIISFEETNDVDLQKFT